MAKLLVSRIWIEEALLHGQATITGVGRFDGEVLELEIEGPDVPQAEAVTATIHERRRHIEFKAID